MDFGLDERVALITGGGGRIGTASCKLLANEGATIIVLDVNIKSANETVDSVEKAGGNALAVECDLTDQDMVDKTIEKIHDETGRIDILVNNAAFLGITEHYAEIGDYKDDMWERQLEVDLSGTYHITKKVFPEMCEQGWGRVITMSSMAGLCGGHGQTSYSTTKSGLIGLTKTLALEGGKHGVTANAIAPGAVISKYSEMNSSELQASDRPVMDQIRKATALKRLGKEEDIGNMVTYLASEQSNYITGQVIAVNGGGDLWTL